MKDVKKSIEDRIIDGALYMTSHPKEVLATIGVVIWTTIVYRAGCQKGLATVMKKSAILISYENHSTGLSNGRIKSQK